MPEKQDVTLSPDEIDELDAAILDYFLKGREEGEPWGMATPGLVYRGLKHSGRLEEVGDPVQGTVQYRIQRLATADHLKNMYDSGCYKFVDDPREQSQENIRSYD